MKKKSNAQTRRNIKRAEARGEVYVPPPVDAAPSGSDPRPKSKGTRGRDDAYDSNATIDVKRRMAAEKLQKTLEFLEENKELKAKDRRSEKRKAMAIATDESGEPADSLLEWFRNHVDTSKQISQTERADSNNRGLSLEKQGRAVPYIAFIGQLSFDTSKDGLLSHITNALKEQKIRIQPDAVRIRFLTDPKTKKPRGMAFVEVDQPETLYALLKLHHTMLDGRRINVERSAGGGKEGRKQKLDQYRKDQQEFMLSQVMKIVQEYVDRKELVAGELDDTAVLVCTRHSPAMVHAALDAYVEKNGREMDNPSAYFTYLITKIAEEGVVEAKTKRARRELVQDERKRPRDQLKSKTAKDWLRESSKFAKRGVDMSASESTTDLTSIFPSLRRGRGR